MTISQSFSIFKHNKRSTTGTYHQPEVTLIYWQAMYGDMMVTVSNEPIDCQQGRPNFRSLVCYVAEVPLTNTNDFLEAYSYWTSNHPLKHALFCVNLSLKQVLVISIADAIQMIISRFA